MTSSAERPDPVSALPGPHRPDVHAGAVALSFALTAVLVLPIRAMVGTTSYGAFYGWVAFTVVLTVAVAWVAGRYLDDAAAVAAVTVGTVAATAPLLLWSVTLFDDPGGDGEVTFLIAVPAAGLAVLAATVVVPQLTPHRLQAGLVVCGVGLLMTLTLGEPAFSALQDVRRDAAKVERLEASGLSPYLSEIDGLDRSFDSTSTLSGVIVGYQVSYAHDVDDFDAPTVEIDYATTTPYPCEGAYQCAEKDGYTLVTDTNGELRSVVATHGSMYLTAQFSADTAGLPSPDEVGKAMADARLVEWSDILSD